MRFLIVHVLFCLMINNCSTLAQSQLNLKPMVNMGKYGKTAIDVNSVEKRENLVRFSLYVFQSSNKERIYTFQRHEMNCNNGEWKIIEMFDRLADKTIKAIPKEFLAKQKYQIPNAESDSYYKFVCRS
jgi:hypothetical protein